MESKLHAFNIAEYGGRPWYDILTRGGFSYAGFFQYQIFDKLKRVVDVHEVDPRGVAGARWRKFLLLPLTLWGVVMCLVRRPSLMLYGVDVMARGKSYDPRMGRVYEWLMKEQISHVHLIHTAATHNLFTRWRRRQGTVIYLEAFDVIVKILFRLRLLWRSFTVPGAHSRLVSDFTERANVVARALPLLSRTLKLIGIRRAWLIDDSRYWHQIVIAARQADIPTTLIQHGRFTPHLEYLAYSGIPPERIPMPDRYVVWNEFWKQQLLGVSVPFARHAEIFLIGGKPSPEVILTPGASDSRGERLRVLVVHEPTMALGEIKAFVERMLSLENIDVLYKIRTDISSMLQVEFLGPATSSPRFKAVASVVPCDVAVGASSTFLYELIQGGIPVGVVQISTMEADGLALAGLASFVDPNADNLREQLVRAASVDALERTHRARELAITVQIEDTLYGL